MSFLVDKQSLDDLNVFGRHGHDSIYTLFCHTHSREGATLLEEMFRYPLSSAEEINNRTATIRFFQRLEIDFPYPGYLFDAVDFYLGNTDARTKLAAENDTLNRKFRSAIGAENEYEQIHKGLTSLIEIINLSKEFIRKVRAIPGHECYKTDIEQFETIFREANIGWTERETGKKRLSYAKTAEYDKILRYDENAAMRKLLHLIAYLDIYISVGKIAKKQSFVFAQAVDGEDNMLDIKGVYHPYVPNAVSNDLFIDKNSNLVFLTGANMAGKSTFMKSLGIAVFLAHVGFPIPAKSMTFSVQDGLFTSINLADNLNLGYSHFYTEVMRVKKVAYEVAKDKKFFVIFDELFRGTNVKDAYDATVAISAAFSKRSKSTFVISTHIIEAGEALQEQCENIQCIFLPTEMRGDTPVYTYTIQPGITADRHGMVIIQNEKIMDILNG